MNTKGRKLFRGMLGALAAIVLMGIAYTTTVMASSIGMIDTADLLDIHAEADGDSQVVGQVMDEGHVAILAKGDGWVQIQAGDIVGWVPSDNLIETEISNEEAVAANEEVIEELAQETQTQEQESTAQETQAQEQESAAQETQVQEQESTVQETQAQVPESEQDMTAAEGTQETAADVEAFAREAAVSAQKTDLEKAKAEAAAREAEALVKAQQEAAARAAAEAKAQAEAAAAAQLKAQQEAAAQAEAVKAAEAARRQAILDANGITEEDLYLLANIIYCEAGCEPYIGKVAVGNVVMNRVKSSRQPDTIRGVIYAKGQFSPVRNGSLDRALRNGSADESCYQAALDALSGSKPVGDKLFFRRVNGRPGQVIGHHVFY